MYDTYWGLSAFGLQPENGTPWFYGSSVHVEALARLEYLVEQKRSLGFLTGPAGAGKSLLLRTLQRNAGRTQQRVACVDLAGVGGDALLWELTAALNLGANESDSRLSLWRRVHDELVGCRLARRHVTLLFDHADRARPDCGPLLNRLVQLGESASAEITMIIADRAPVLDRRKTVEACASLWERADLRVVLQPLDPVETRLYVEEALKRIGCRRDVFAPGTLDELHRLTRGIPRAINRLCDLALLAHASSGRKTIDADAFLTIAAEFDTAMDAPSECSGGGILV